MDTNRLVFIGILDTDRIIKMAGIDTFYIMFQARKLLIPNF